MARGALWHAGHRLLSLIRYRAIPMAGHGIMRHRSPHHLLIQWPEGEIPLGPRVCLLAHWDGAGEVRPHVLHYAQAMAASGLSVVFITNSGSLQAGSLQALKLVCAGVMIRRNVGYDFGAWREALERLGLPRANTTMVAMANDSVYGPLWSIEELFAAVDLGVADAWSATDSWQGRYHLQSYLMAFGPAVMGSETWRQFWRTVRPTWSKHWIVWLYELGLTQSLLRAGFRCRSIWPYETLIKAIDLSLLDESEDGPDLSDPMVKARRKHALRLREAIAARVPLNPTSDLWRQLLQQRFPFIKRELLRSNPTRVADVAEWRDVISQTPGATITPIERDLERTLKNRTP